MTDCAMKRGFANVYDAGSALAIAMEARRIPARGEKAPINKNVEPERTEPSAEHDAMTLEVRRLTAEALELHEDFLMNIIDLESRGLLYETDAESKKDDEDRPPSPRLTKEQIAERRSLK
jgi:hypothetical protein